LARQAQPIRLEINVKAHQRSGRVSQYLTELKQATIININNTLKEEMEFFEWNT
jgi:preprotein translocase subunit SecB